MEEKDMTLMQRLSLTTEAVYALAGCHRDAIYADMKRDRGKFVREVDLQTSRSLFNRWRRRI